MRARGRTFHRKSRSFTRPAIFIIFFWAFPAYMRVGLYFRVCHLRFARCQSPKTKPCFRKHQREQHASLRPKGSQSLTLFRLTFSIRFSSRFIHAPRSLPLIPPIAGLQLNPVVCIAIPNLVFIAFVESVQGFPRIR